MKKKTILSAIILIVTIIVIAATMLYVVLEQEKIKNRIYEPTDMNNVVITLTRSRCFGVCPTYNVTIYGNGTVLYEGIANVNSTGIQRSNISENQVRQLISEFKKIDYFSLNETDIASHVVYDAPLFTTSLSINGKIKTIHHYETADPPVLTDLENTIDEIVNSSQWIQ
jgi:(2Fe-2S) ferredoxin